MNTRRIAGVAVATIGWALLAPQTTNAQAAGTTPRAARACRMPDTTGAWFASQRELLTDAGRTWSNDTLRVQLLRAAGLEPATQRITPQWGWQLVGDSSGAGSVRSADRDDALARLRALAAMRGSEWPTTPVVGVAGARATWLLVQRDSALSRTAMHRMMEAGSEGSLPADVAVLEDRVRLQNGRKQIYGTQLVRTARGVSPAPLEDSAHVDLRREAAGLPPLAASMCAATRSATPR